MERLTFEGNFCDIAMCRENPCPYNGSCSQKETWERWKVYEDTGLTPEEIERIVDAYGRGHTLRSESALRLEIIRDIETDQLRELAQAEKEGRLVVLPCKVGDTVWANFEHYVFGPKPCKPTETTVKKVKSVQFADSAIVFFADVEFRILDPYYDDGRLMLCSADVTVGAKFGSWDVAYLTREEAEAALKGEGNG